MTRKFILTILCILLAGCASNQPVQEDIEPTVEPGTYACRMVDYYDYSKPVPWSDWAGDEYFDDTMMFGDSRLGTIRLLGTLPPANLHYIDSLTVARFDITEYDPVYELVDEEMRHKTLMEGARNAQSGNLYFMLGINELGSNADKIIAAYETVLNEIKELHPNASIYVILVYMPDHTSGLNENVVAGFANNLNEQLRQLCNRLKVYYIDMDEVLVGDTGRIKLELTRGDGVHFNRAGAELASDFLRMHVVWRDRYVKEICE